MLKVWVVDNQHDVKVFLNKEKAIAEFNRIKEGLNANDELDFDDEIEFDKGIAIYWTREEYDTDVRLSITEEIVVE